MIFLSKGTYYKFLFLWYNLFGDNMEKDNKELLEEIDSLKVRVVKLENYVKFRKVMSIITIALTIIVFIIVAIAAYFYVNNLLDILNTI